MVQTIFAEWQQRSPLFASSLILDKSGLSKEYDVRPFIMQANELDSEFIQRLLSSEGINWLIDESQLKVSSSSEPIQPQKLRLIDDNAQYQSLERQNIRFHRSSAVESSDSITNLVGSSTVKRYIVKAPSLAPTSALVMMPEIRLSSDLSVTISTAT